MKTFLNLHKILFLCLALILCASQLRAVQAAPQGFIQDMIDAAAENSTVNIPAGTYSETLLVDKNLTLKGVSLADTILQPANAHQRVIKVTNGHNLRLEYLRVTGGHPDAPNDDGGGGVYLAGGNLTLDHVQIDHNQASYGGGVFQESTTGSVTASNSMIDNNTASITGGGVYSAGSATFSYASLVNNTAGNHGGGMHVAGSASLTGGEVTGNHALNGNGGGVNVNNGLTVSGTIFTSNTAGGYSDISGSGGAISQWNIGSTVTITGSVFSGNTAQFRGGAVFIRESFLTLGTSTFTSNTVNSGTSGDDTYGGGAYAGGGLDGSHLTFTTNSAKCADLNFPIGGGLYIQRPTTGPSSVTQSTFDGNLAWLGSGIDSDTRVQLTLTHSSFINNGAVIYGQPRSGYGGGVEAVWVHGDGLLFQNNKVINFGGGLNAIQSVLTNSRFINNTAASGGGVYTHSSFNGTNLLLAGNDSNSGAALYVYGGSAVLRHVTIGRPARGAGSAIHVDSGKTLELKNSIISAYAVGIRVLGTATEDYNLFFNNGVDYDPTGGGTIVYGIHNVALKDPLFANPAGNDYHLRASSPAIGKGTNLGVTTDLDGRTRIGRFDIGAYQFWASTYVPLIRK